MMVAPGNIEGLDLWLNPRSGVGVLDMSFEIV